MSKDENKTTKPATGSRPEDEFLGAGRTVGYGVQHILAMFGGVIAVPIIIGGAAGLDTGEQAFLIACALFVSGAATILQTIGVRYFGSQLPLVQGTSFASVATMLAIIADRGTEGLRVVFGAALVAATIGLIITPFFARIIRFFPPVVTGTIIVVIGLSLMPVAGRWIVGTPTVMVDGEEVANESFAAMDDVALAMFTFLVVIVLTKIHVLSRLAILLGLAVGTIVALPFGMASFSPVADASPVSVPQPFEFGMPLFEIGAIVSMTIVILVIMVETVADILAVGEVIDTKVDSRRVADGLRADMLSSAVGPVFNTFPATAFSQNVGLVALTGIKSRFAVAAGGGILLLLGLSPMAAAVFGAIPSPVLGGAGIVLFGTVAASGVRTLAKVDYNGNNNVIIVAASVAFGLLPVVSPGFWHAFPSWFETIFESGISAGAIVAVTLNLFFNVLGSDDSSTMVSAAPAVRVQEGELDVLEAGGSLDADSYEPDTITVGSRVKSIQIEWGKRRFILHRRKEF